MTVKWKPENERVRLVWTSEAPGPFKAEFDWTTLPLPYRKRIGAPVSQS